MDETLGFVEDLNVASDSLKKLEDNIIELLTAIGDCCHFIQSYIHRGLKGVGHLPGSDQSMILMLLFCVSLERTLKQWGPGELSQVEYFENRLSLLRSRINGGVLSQILVTGEIIPKVFMYCN